MAAAEEPKVDGGEAQAAAAPAQGASGAPGARKSRKGVLLLGSLLGLLGIAYLAFSMAVLRKEADRSLSGPYLGTLTGSELQVNLAGDDAKRYLVMSLNAEYHAYDEDYFAERVSDPLYAAQIKDALLGVSATKTREEVADAVLAGAFLEEIRAAAEPLLFPLHLGGAERPTEADPASGLEPGASIARSTFRGLLSEHAIQLDVPGHTLALDGGPLVRFTGTERDLLVTDAANRTLFLDVSGLEPAFRGEVEVGAKGALRKVFRNTWLIQ